MENADVHDAHTRDVHARTGAAWDDAATIYERDRESDTERLRSGEVLLRPHEPTLLGDLSGCRRAIHLQCAGGSDTLSLWNLGAQQVVGVDISPRMIAVARAKSDALSAPAAWFCSDVLNTPRELDSTADLVYTGCGALPWMMDLDAWAAIVYRLLTPNGRLFVYEGHPLDWVWESDADQYRFDPDRGDYFSRDRRADTRWPAPLLDSLDRPDDAPRATERQHTLGEIVTAVARVGLRIERLDEFPEPFWDHFPSLCQDQTRRLPHTFALIARREDR